MEIRNRARALAAASLLALAVLTAPANFAHASAPGVTDAAVCGAAGYEWDAKRGCLNKSCPLRIQLGLPPGGPGESATDSMGREWVCDGGSGRWYFVGNYIEPKAPASGPASPRPTTAQR